MTEQDTEITVTEVDRIERGDATRPWSMNEMTVSDLSDIHALHRRLDTVFVPWGVQEPVNELEALFTVDNKVIERRSQSIADVAERVAELVEQDPRLQEYIVFEHLSPSVEAARIDDHRTRVRMHWTVEGGEE